jgi:hypothetical protein
MGTGSSNVYSAVQFVGSVGLLGIIRGMGTCQLTDTASRVFRLCNFAFDSFDD